MAISRFQKSHRHQSVFECRICDRKTRDTDDNGSVQLCPECNEAALLENTTNDNELTVDQVAKNRQEIQELNQAAVDKGGVIKGFVAKPKQAAKAVKASLDPAALAYNRDTDARALAEQINRPQTVEGFFI